MKKKRNFFPFFWVGGCLVKKEEIVSTTKCDKINPSSSISLSPLTSSSTFQKWDFNPLQYDRHHQPSICILLTHSD